MKLTYRGQSYKMLTSTQSDSIASPRIKLIYRGQIYYTAPRSAVISKAVTSSELTVTLIYRGVTYEHILQLPKPYQQLRGINWRCQIN